MVLDHDSWTGKVYVDGGWVEGGNGDAPIVEPATGCRARTVRRGLG